MVCSAWLYTHAEYMHMMMWLLLTWTEKQVSVLSKFAATFTLIAMRMSCNVLT